MKSKKIELGDVFSIETNNGIGYLQYVESPKGDDVELIRVFYNLHKNTEILNVDLETAGGYFFIRFPLKAALRKKIIRFVEHIDLPENFQPPIFFRTINPFGDGWQIVNSETLKRETVRHLTDEHKKLSPWGGMNETLIKELLEKGWRLENWTADNIFA
ncbi:hypothetical protein [Flavobacterium lindanitolerans]|uniref:hypothetical protein n=1 Tax=Flavobacterium lindanitolerans TaxID=428988 RepID=UPI0023F19942|nr:hypothetical protein [Flavobacterium lindanitolerans]